MDTTYMTIILSKTPWKARKKQRTWRAISRLTLLCLAAMFFARLVLLMIDVIQLQIDTVGAVTVPACAIVFIVTGWKFREWWEEYKLLREEKQKMPDKKVYFRECPECGAHLDPGETCDCQQKSDYGVKMKTPGRSDGRTGRANLRGHFESRRHHGT